MGAVTCSPAGQGATVHARSDAVRFVIHRHNAPASTTGQWLPGKPRGPERTLDRQRALPRARGPGRGAHGAHGELPLEGAGGRGPRSGTPRGLRAPHRRSTLARGLGPRLIVRGGVVLTEDEFMTGHVLLRTGRAHPARDAGPGEGPRGVLVPEERFGWKLFTRRCQARPERPAQDREPGGEHPGLLPVHVQEDGRLAHRLRLQYGST
jgi:hypothetical protein